MKKITIVALSALCVLAFAACDKKGGSSAAAKKAAANGDYSKLKVVKDPATKKAYDFGGMEVAVYDWWTNPDAAPASKAAEDQLNYRKYLEETYNFKCQQKDLQAGWGDHPAEVANYCITGGDDARIFIIDSRSALSGAANGLWADVSKCPDIDWTKSKWNKAVCSVLPGYTFAVGKPEPRQCIFFNKRVLQENGFDPDEPYNLQKAGKWTWAKFEEMCDKLTKDTDNDGIIDQYALSGFNSEFAAPAIYSNGGQITGRDSNGKLYLDTSDKTMEAWNWSQHIFDNYNRPQEAGANWDQFKSDFINGFTAFYNDQEYDAQPNGLLANMNDDWGMVCFPLGPNGDGKYFTMNQDNMLIIPAYYTQDKVNKIMKIYDFWTDDVPGYEDEDSWKESYYGSFRDTRAVDETMQYMMDNSKSWDAWLVPNFNWSQLSWTTCSSDPSETPQEAYDRMRNELQAALDDVNK